MGWPVLVLSAAISASPQPARRLNVEAIGLMIAGGLGLGVGVGFKIASDRVYDQMEELLERDRSTPMLAAALLSEAQRLRTLGKTQEGLGGALALTGGVLLLGGALWLLIEGPTTAVVSVVPSREGLMAGVNVRF